MLLWVLDGMPVSLYPKRRGKNLKNIASKLKMGLSILRKLMVIKWPGLENHYLGAPQHGFTHCIQTQVVGMQLGTQPDKKPKFLLNGQ